MILTLGFLAVHAVFVAPFFRVADDPIIVNVNSTITSIVVVAALTRWPIAVTSVIAR